MKSSRIMSSVCMFDFFDNHNKCDKSGFLRQNCTMFFPFKLFLASFGPSWVLFGPFLTPCLALVGEISLPFSLSAPMFQQFLLPCDHVSYYTKEVQWSWVWGVSQSLRLTSIFLLRSGSLTCVHFDAMVNIASGCCLNWKANDVLTIYTFQIEKLKLTISDSWDSSLVSD